jgi:cell division protein FtsL
MDDPPFAIPLSWDLFVGALFATIVAYSIVIGAAHSARLLIAACTAFVAAQGIGRIMERWSNGANATLEVMGIATSVSMLAIVKVGLFILFAILLTTVGSIDVQYENRNGPIVSLASTVLFGIVTACLFTSIVLTTLQGVNMENASLSGMSTFVAAIAKNGDLWFALPAIALIAVGYLRR